MIIIQYKEQDMKTKAKELIMPLIKIRLILLAVSLLFVAYLLPAAIFYSESNYKVYVAYILLFDVGIIVSIVISIYSCRNSILWGYKLLNKDGCVNSSIDIVDNHIEIKYLDIDKVVFRFKKADIEKMHMTKHFIVIRLKMRRLIISIPKNQAIIDLLTSA